MISDLSGVAVTRAGQLVFAIAVIALFSKTLVGLKSAFFRSMYLDPLADGGSKGGYPAHGISMKHMVLEWFTLPVDVIPYTESSRSQSEGVFYDYQGSGRIAAVYPA